MENEERFRFPNLRTAFCASFEGYEEDCPSEILGARARGAIRIEPGRLRDSECLLMIFTPDLSGYRFEKTVFMDGACRCGKGGPVLRGIGRSLITSWPYSFTPPKPGDDILVFGSGNKPEKRRFGKMFTLWRPDRNGACRQLAVYSLYMFLSQDDFREFIRQKSENYMEKMKADLVYTEQTISRLKANIEKLKTRISGHRPDSYAAAADIELSCIGIGKPRSVPGRI